MQEQFQVAKKAKKARHAQIAGSQANPLCIQTAPRKNRAKDVPRPEITSFCGLKIVERTKYLGLELAATIPDTTDAIRKQVRKYADYNRIKTHTGVLGLDKSINSAYGK